MARPRVACDPQTLSDWGRCKIHGADEHAGAGTRRRNVHVVDLRVIVRPVLPLLPLPTSARFLRQHMAGAGQQ